MKCCIFSIVLQDVNAFVRVHDDGSTDMVNRETDQWVPAPDNLALVALRKAVEFTASMQQIISCHAEGRGMPYIFNEGDKAVVVDHYGGVTWNRVIERRQTGFEPAPHDVAEKYRGLVAKIMKGET